MGERKRLDDLSRELEDVKAASKLTKLKQEFAEITENLNSMDTEKLEKFNETTKNLGVIVKSPLGIEKLALFVGNLAMDLPALDALNMMMEYLSMSITKETMGLTKDAFEFASMESTRNGLDSHFNLLYEAIFYVLRTPPYACPSTLNKFQSSL